MAALSSGYPASGAASSAAPPQRSVRPAPKLGARPSAENLRASRLRHTTARGGPLGDVTNILGSRAAAASQKSLAKLGAAAPAVAPAVASTLPLPQQLGASAAAQVGNDGRGDGRASITEGLQAAAPAAPPPPAGLPNSSTGAGADADGPEQRAREAEERPGGGGTGRTQEGAPPPPPPPGEPAAQAGTFAPRATAVPDSGGRPAAVTEHRGNSAVVAAAVGADDSLGDPQDVQEYVSGIYHKMFHDEVLYLPRSNYMESQRDITGRMRGILVDWLVEVHMKYQLRIETLFLTISLLDRYLARMPVMRSRLQLVGVVAMFIASKFEEMRPPDVHEFVYITDNSCTRDEILVMECTMLTTLGFQIAGPTAVHFLELLHRMNSSDEMHRQLTQYAAELALVELHMLQHTPSELAAAAVLVGNEALGRQPAWPAVLARESLHSEQALRGCAQELRSLLRGAASTNLQAVRRKFSLPRYQSVARIAV